MGKVLILEDEKYTLRFLCQLVAEHPLVKKVIPVSISIDAVQKSKEEQPIIAFLDIELELEDPMNGVETACLIKSVSPETKIIFVTGYAQYVMESFSVHPYDYVMKPIMKDKLFKIITEILTQSRTRSLTVKKLRFRNKGNIIFLDPDQILFIEKRGKGVYVHCKEEVYAVQDGLNELEFVLPEQFIRSHKSYFINLNNISLINSTGNRSYAVYFENYDQTAWVSRNKYDKYKHLFSPDL